MHRCLKRSLCGLSLLTISACTSTKHLPKPLTGHYVATPVTIDGDDSEWPSPYPNYDSKAMISFATANDRDNLYITLKAGDEMMQLKLLAGGLKVYIDPTGKKSESLSIQYPLKGSARPPEKPMNRSANAEQLRPSMRDTAGHRRPEMPIPNDVVFNGLGDCSGTSTVVRVNSCDIRIKMAKNAYGELVWEASIPLKAIYGSSSLPASGTPISIGFEVGAMAMPAPPMGGERGGPPGGGMGGGMPPGGGMSGGGGGMGGPGGGMGGPGGGRGGPGGMPGGDGEHSNLSQTTKTWTKTGVVFQ